MILENQKTDPRNAKKRIGSMTSIRDLSILVDMKHFVPTTIGIMEMANYEASFCSSFRQHRSQGIGSPSWGKLQPCQAAVQPWARPQASGFVWEDTWRIAPLSIDPLRSLSKWR